MQGGFDQAAPRVRATRPLVPSTAVSAHLVAELEHMTRVDAGFGELLLDRIARPLPVIGRLIAREPVVEQVDGGAARRDARDGVLRGIARPRSIRTLDRVFRAGDDEGDACEREEHAAPEQGPPPHSAAFDHRFGPPNQPRSRPLGREANRRCGRSRCYAQAAKKHTSPAIIAPKRYPPPPHETAKNTRPPTKIVRGVGSGAALSAMDVRHAKSPTRRKPESGSMQKLRDDQAAYPGAGRYAGITPAAPRRRGRS